MNRLLKIIKRLQDGHTLYSPSLSIRIIYRKSKLMVLDTEEELEGIPAPDFIINPKDVMTGFIDYSNVIKVDGGYL